MIISRKVNNRKAIHNGGTVQYRTHSTINARQPTALPDDLMALLSQARFGFPRLADPPVVVRATGGDKMKAGDYEFGFPAGR